MIGAGGKRDEAVAVVRAYARIVQGQRLDVRVKLVKLGLRIRAEKLIILENIVAFAVDLRKKNRDDFIFTPLVQRIEVDNSLYQERISDRRRLCQQPRTCRLRQNQNRRFHLRQSTFQAVRHHLYLYLRVLLNPL